MNFRYCHGDRPLEGYTIKRGVGHGGFGEVYYALSDGGREVALKSIFRNQEIELRGVRHCINLKSPHLVSIFDVKTGENNTPFVVMEYIAGPSLRDLLHDSPHGLGEQKAGYLVKEIAKGLIYLHERGIVHRDLKPENIFYEDGYVKIGDYGLSKYISASRQSGQTISVGTIHYMAPEIGSGVYDRGIDIYAMGILLFEFLTGNVPFTGDSFGEILMKHLTAQPDLSPINEPFRSVIARALEKKPEDRYPSIKIMVDDLLQHNDVHDSVSSFNHEILSAASHKAGIDRAEIAEEPIVSPSPLPPLPRPAHFKKAEPGKQSAARHSNTLHYARKEFINMCKFLVAFLPSALKTAAAKKTETGKPFPPSPAARLLWMFIAAALIGIGLSAVAVTFLGNHSGEETAIGLAIGLGAFGYTVFALYRGLWARNSSFWRRTCLPFLLATSIVSALISVMTLIFCGLMGFGEEEFLLSAATAAGACVVSVFLMMSGRLMKKYCSEYVKGHDSEWSARPPHPALRFVFLSLAAIALITSLSIFIPVIFLSSMGRDRIPFLCIGIFVLSVSLLFFKQSLQKHRGPLWYVYIRPFIIIATAATLTICAILLLSGELNGRDERDIALVVSIHAFVFGVFAFVMKAMTAAGASKKSAPSRWSLKAAKQSPGYVLPACSGMGLMFWLIGILAALGTGIVNTGLLHVLQTEHVYHAARNTDLVSLSLAVWVGTIITGSLFILISRFPAGFFHLSRGFVGQLSLWISMILYYYVIDHVQVFSSTLFVIRKGKEGEVIASIIALFVLIFSGCGILYWPYKRKARTKQQRAAA